MNIYADLSCEYRGEVFDLKHSGCLSVVDESGKVIYSLGSPDNIVCYRSSSKPVQALPVIARDLDKKYGISEEESAIFSGSHAAEKFHVDALESIAKKAGLKEEDMIMLPTWPANEAHKLEIIRGGGDKRKFYHNCSGKHLASMLLQRELGGEVRDYWKEGSLAQNEIKRVICLMSETEDAKVSIDGCGVPVFSVPLWGIARAYKNLACIDTIRDEKIRKAAKRYVPVLHKYPLMMRGTGFLCSLMNYDENVIAKGGANGVYGFGLKKQRLGISFKVADGTENAWPIVILQLLKDLGALNKEHEERLMSLRPYDIFNDNNTLVGVRKSCFSLK